MFSPRQQNALRRVVERHGLNEDIFDFFFEDNELLIEYKPQGFRFRVVAPQPIGSTPALLVYFTPSRSGHILNPKKETNRIVESWEDVEVSLKSWLDWLTEEYELPADTTTRLVSNIERHLENLTDKMIANRTVQQPSLAHLHSTVQQVASSRFASAHYSDAIQKACTALEKAVQVKSGQPATAAGTSVMTTAFSKNNALIHLSNDPNEQFGFMNLYQGAVQALRNHFAHGLIELTDPARALEWLGFISALFYKLDEAQPQATPPSP